MKGHPVIEVVMGAHNLFEDACTLSKKKDIDVMIGNAMTLPVVNALITATMGITTSDPF